MIDRRELDRIIETAFAEDLPHGDITSNVFVPESATAIAELNPREPGVFAGAEVFEAVMTTFDPSLTVIFEIADGESFEAGAVLARVSGSARSILGAERIALNLVQRMCAIATLTRAYVDAAGTGVRVADTRKTTPGLRALERHAVLCGGGHNHRYSPSDAVVGQNNHPPPHHNVHAPHKNAPAPPPPPTHLEVEVDRLDQIEPVLAGGVDTIMLDNFTLDELREGVAIVNHRAVVEASGGVNLDTIAGIAATGVDVISVGALTHSVHNLDLGLDISIRSAP